MHDANDLSQLRVLVVDDEDDIRLGLKRLMQRLGARVSEAADGAAALRELERRPADLVLSDLMMPGMTGAELLPEIKRRWPGTEVAILTGYGTVQTAVQCLQEGAAHFLTKPFDNEEILRLVRRLGCQILARRSADGGGPGATLVAEDPGMKRVLELVRRAAPSPMPVLIEGESGTGKELVARAVHAASQVAELPFLAVNCAALSDTLLESELFGHVRGAFTGADRDRRGLFAEAGGGTVFLDEVASMSPAFQGKLLRVLQEKVVRPVGGSRDLPVRFRLVAATNRDLQEQVSRGAFREDLYYRLQVVRIHIPPLRERPQDILPLAASFIARAAELCRISLGELPVLGADAERALLAYSWPGNVRELENAVQRAVVVCVDGAVRPYHLGIGGGAWGEPTAGEGQAGSYSEAKQRALVQFQREFVERALERTRGNVSQAAEACGLTRAAFQKILRQLGVDRTDFLAD
ncbi:MAG: sigma-54-dependent Fis family transcriptional regulator [Planctomycetes bacterium]|nr:sigma-54-dependent Fis family transcriptional regulator [Planctomycetota bacterium]